MPDNRDTGFDTDKCKRVTGGILAAILLACSTRHGQGGWLDPMASSALLLGLGLITIILARGVGNTMNEPAAGMRRSERLWPMSWFLLILLIFYAGSSAITDNWFFPTQWNSSSAHGLRPLAFGWLRSLILALGVALGFKPLLRSPRALALTWLALTGLAVYHLHAATGFAMIYRVDSPSFVYRFWSFLHTFPRPGFYDPHWNAGMPVPFLVASGIWSVGIWLLPFLAWIPPEQLYTPFLAVFFLGIIPLLAWTSLAWIGAKPRACWIAALLALAPGQRYWVHLLHYGTAPALFAMSMAMPLAALVYKFLYLDTRPRPATLILILLCGFTLLSWPGAFVIAVPFLLVLLFHIRRLFPQKWKWALGIGLLLLLLLTPLALVPMRYSNIAKFLEPTSHLTFREHLLSGWNVLGHNLRGTHPLILIFGFVGCCYCPRRTARRFFGPLIVLLVLGSGWGEEFKKLLQTERLIIPAALVAIIPAAWWLDHLIQRSIAVHHQRNLAGAALRTVTAWTVALLVVGGYQGAKTWRGKGLAPFQVMPESTRELVAWLSTHVPTDGRVMFAGRAVHGYGGAKIAALPYFSGRAMMAADFYGFSPKLVEYQYPPREFRYGGPDVLFSFMDLYNVTHIVTWHDDWKEVLSRTTNYYRLAHAIGRSAIYEAQRDSTMFLKGSGHVKATFDRFDLELEPGQDNVVIKYNWAPGWRAGDGAIIYPYDAGRNVTLIGVKPGSNRQVTLRYRP